MFFTIIFIIIDIITLNVIKHRGKLGMYDKHDYEAFIDDHAWLTDPDAGYHFVYWDRCHRIIKRTMILGGFKWMFAVFWLPYEIAVIYNFTLGYGLLSFLYGFLPLLISSATGPVTIPLGFFIGMYGIPAIYKKILFHQEWNYFDENYMKFIGLNSKEITASAMAGTTLGSFSGRFSKK